MTWQVPWLEISILLPLLGAAWVATLRNPELARKWCLFFSACGFLAAVAAWLDFEYLHPYQSELPSQFLARTPAHEFLVIDLLSAPLFPMAAGLHFLTILATLRTKVRRI